MYPLKIFAVFIHETFHALATVLTSGHVVSMVVLPGSRDTCSIWVENPS
ncbi:MAG: M50 family metallopeptidase [Candidatus Binatia bacterium]